MLAPLLFAVLGPLLFQVVKTLHLNTLFVDFKSAFRYLRVTKTLIFPGGVTNTGNGERGTGNRERESGNECTAVILMRIQNGGQKHANRVNM